MTEHPQRKVIYLDNAATSWPKPDCVYEAMETFMRKVGASPGRSGHHLANEAERIRFDAREAIAELLGLSDPMRVVFALNATTALNMVMQGLLPEGSHVVTTSMEHNSVMRPLRALEQRGVAVSIVPCQADGSISVKAIGEHIKPETRLIVVNHASNVCGTVLPIREIGALARQRGVTFLLDAAQTVGCWPINMAADNIDLLAFSGHKSLLGPTGTGGLAFSDNFDIATLPATAFGGTGSGSEQETHPEFLPDKYEIGTPNIAGLAGLDAGVRFVLQRGVEEIQQHERDLANRLIDGLQSIAGMHTLGVAGPLSRTAVVSFTCDGRSCSDIAHHLDERFAIMSRPGLQCAPRAHRTMGTFPDGTVRLSPGFSSTVADIEQTLDAVADLVGAKAVG
ncbi:MAG: aminotransferase class V-fold PLP-dependent enzyme [Phycisphaerales bacterium]|nr:MAG: aminotransferase class V-fold PLP-dependent enzyme [Phycisphaerales bacterium]